MFWSPDSIRPSLARVAGSRRADARLAQRDRRALDVFDRPPMEVETRLAAAPAWACRTAVRRPAAPFDRVDGVEQPEDDQGDDAANDGPACRPESAAALETVAAVLQECPRDLRAATTAGRGRCLRHRVSDPTGRRHYCCGRRPRIIVPGHLVSLSAGLVRMDTQAEGIPADQRRA